MNRTFQLRQLTFIFCLGAYSQAAIVLSQETQQTKIDKIGDQRTQEKVISIDDEDKYNEMTLDDLSKDFTTKMRAYSKRYRAAPTKEEKRKVVDSMPRALSYRTRLVELINEEPGSEGGLEVIDWWYRRGGRREGTEIIIGLILKNYSELKSIEKYIPRIAWHLPAEEAEKHLRSLIKVNSFDAVKASASYELHQLLNKKAKGLNGEAAEVVKAEVRKLRDAIYSQYADAADISGAKFVGLLEAVAFAAKLKIGQPVPDIVGDDLDGVGFKLSDYDGKVRVISFWGDW